MDTTTSASLGEHTLDVDGAQLRYRIAGHGPLLVFHPPGWGIGADPYFATLTPLHDTFTVVYVWPRGSASSPVRNGTDLNVDRFVADLEALRDHLGVSSFGLAGHSHGGLVALHYALRHPDAVDHLLLLSSQLTGVPAARPDASRLVLHEDPPDVVAAMSYLADHGGFDYLFRLDSDAAAKAFLSRILPLYFTNPTAMAPLVEALSSTVLPYRTLQTVTATDGNYTLDVASLAGLTVPTVIAAGRLDRICPLGQSRGLAGIMPRSELVVFERSGHFPWLEEPDAFFERVVAAIMLNRGGT